MSPRARISAHLLALLAVSAFLRGWGVAEVEKLVGDEEIQVAAARVYSAGRLGEDTWWNPPAAYATISASMAVLGDGPAGWRVPNLVLGSLLPLLVAWLGMALFQGGREGWVAAWLLAVDPIHVLVSRSTFEELGASFFFLLAVPLLLRARAGGRTLELAGLALGAGLAFKHYFAVSSAVVVGFALAGALRAGPPARRVHGVAALFLLPAAVYVATYLPWLARGHGLGELVGLHVDLLFVQQGRSAASYDNPLLGLAGTAGTWFLSPSLLGGRLDGAEGWSRYHLLARNLPAWLLVLPAGAAVAVRAVRRREQGDALCAALFLASWVPLLLVGRPIFIYSAAAILPLALLALARGIELARARIGWVAWLPVAAAVAFGLYCYPLTVFIRVPDALYGGFFRALVGGPMGGREVEFLTHPP